MRNVWRKVTKRLRKTKQNWQRRSTFSNNSSAVSNPRACWPGLPFSYHFLLTFFQRLLITYWEVRCQALYVCYFTYNTAKPWVKYYPHLHFYYPGREVKWAQSSDPGWAWNPTPGAAPLPWQLLSERRPCSQAGCSKNLLILVANISNLISDNPGPNIEMCNYFWYDFFKKGLNQLFSNKFESIS